MDEQFLRRHLAYRVAQLERLRALPRGCPQIIIDHQERMVREAYDRLRRHVEHRISGIAGRAGRADAKMGRLGIEPSPEG